MAEVPITPQVRPKLQDHRAQWISRVNALVKQIAEWSEAKGWKVEFHEKEITEEPFGTYLVPEIVVRLSEGELIVNPVGLHIAGGEGRVDLEALPTLARVKLIAVEGRWKPYADPNVPIRMDWNQENFVQLAEDLLR